MNRKKIGKSSILICILLVGLLIAGCNGQQSVGVIGGADGPTSIFLTEKEGSQLTAVSIVLDWTPNINHTGIYVAQSKGYFTEQGLDVEVIQPGDNLALSLVAAGQADFGVSYQEEVTYARAADLPVVSLAAVIQHNTSCFAAPVDHNITSVADFGGKTYGGWGGEVEESLLNYLLEQENVSEPIEIINLGTADFFSAMESGVDFSWIFYGVTGVEAELRGIELDTICLRDLDPAFDYYTPVIVAEEGWLADNPEVAKKFMLALSKGYQYADAYPDEAADILCAAVPELDRELVQAGQLWLAGQYQGDADYWGEQKAAVWNGFSDWLIARGLLAADFSAAEAYTNDYLPRD